MISATVYFNHADRQLTLKGKKLLKKFIIYIFEREKKELQRIDYIFCSDKYLLQINRQFLQHDYYTDIITFNISDASSIKGEIYISLDRVKENALIYSTTFQNEALRVIFHGALHLCGYNDKTKKEIIFMRALENKYLHFFLTHYK